MFVTPARAHCRFVKYCALIRSEWITIGRRLVLQYRHSAPGHRTPFSISTNFEFRSDQLFNSIIFVRKDDIHLVRRYLSNIGSEGSLPYSPKSTTGPQLGRYWSSFWKAYVSHAISSFQAVQLKCGCIPHLPHACCMSCTSHPPWFNHSYINMGYATDNARNSLQHLMVRIVAVLCSIVWRTTVQLIRQKRCAFHYEWYL